MKSTSLVLSIGTACLALQSAHGMLLFSEGFNYPTGNLGGNVNPGSGLAWSGSSTQLAVGSGTLTYPGYPGLAGNELVYTAGPSAVTSTNSYAAVTGGSIYYSFLIQATALPTANNYITSLNPGASAPNGSSDAMAVYVGANGSGWKIGVRNGNSGAAYESTVLSLNTTYMVVTELTLGSTPTVSLFLDPITGESQPTANATQTGTIAVTSVDDVGFKAQSSTAAGDFLIDDLSIGTAWADVTVPEPSVFALAGLGVLALIGFRRRH